MPLLKNSAIWVGFGCMLNPFWTFWYDYWIYSRVYVFGLTAAPHGICNVNIIVDITAQMNHAYHCIQVYPWTFPLQITAQKWHAIVWQRGCRISSSKLRGNWFVLFSMRSGFYSHQFFASRHVLQYSCLSLVRSRGINCNPGVNPTPVVLFIFELWTFEIDFPLSP